VFSSLTFRLFSSADEDGFEGYCFSSDRKIDDFLGFLADCGRNLWSVDVEGVVRSVGVLLPDNDIGNDCLAVVLENF